MNSALSGSNVFVASAWAKKHAAPQLERAQGPSKALMYISDSKHSWCAALAPTSGRAKKKGHMWEQQAMAQKLSRAQGVAPQCSAPTSKAKPG